MAYYNYQTFPNVGYQAPQLPSLIEVSSEDEVARYPVAPGNSVHFRNVKEPFFYTKTMTSQFGQPIIEKYGRIEEAAPKPVEYATKEELAALAAAVEKLTKKAKKDE